MSDAYVDLEARQPSFFGTIFRDIGKVASTGIHAVEKIAKNPVVQTAAEAAIPGDAELMAAASVFPSICSANQLNPDLCPIEKSLEN